MIINRTALNIYLKSIQISFVIRSCEIPCIRSEKCARQIRSANLYPFNDCYNFIMHSVEDC